jgi:Flp pilus assembly protein TadG
MFRPLSNMITKTARRFGKDQSGVALVYVTMCLPVIVAMGLLAIDMGRVNNLQSTLQHGADALALAGAGELDLLPNAVARSERAIDTLINSNTAQFATTAVTVDQAAVTTCYLATLPANDASPIDTGLCLNKGDAASSTSARFVRVLVTPQTFNTIFPASLFGGGNSGTVGAEATAGFQAAVCKFTPMFMCNPYEAAGNSDILRSVELLDHFADPAKRKRLINMKQTGGNSAQYFPGNFGWLVPASGSQSASVLREQVGMANPPACFVANGVELRTGNIESIRFGFNTRFDQYDGPMNSKSSDSAFRPAQNVRRGGANDKANGKGGPCNPDDEDKRDLPFPPNPPSPANAVPHFGYLYKDACFYTNSCTLMGGRMGDGNWNKQLYWDKLHDGVATTLPAAIAGANVSRYDVYRYELSTPTTYTNFVERDSWTTGNGGEKGNPRCYGGAASTLSDNPDRRIFHAAVLNCQALNASGTYGPIHGGSGNLLPVVAFAQFFLTEPVGGDKNNTAVADGDVWAEMVRIDKPGEANSVARDLVQLYR